MAVSPVIDIGLTIPQDVQEQIRANVVEVVRGNPYLVIPDVGQFRVQLMRVAVVSGDERARVQRAFDEVRQYFQDHLFTVSTVTLRVSRDSQSATLSVRSCRREAHGEGGHGSAGHLGRLFTTLHQALLDQGIGQECMTRPGMFYPNITCAWTREPGTQISLETAPLPAASQVRWATSSAGLFST